MFPVSPESGALAHVHDQARRDARRLRREAVDDFWRGANAVWQRSLAGGQTLALRSATRLQARLARRSNRSTSTPSKA